jgi:hypothetical protein
MTDRNHVIAAMLEPSIRINVVEIVLDDISNGYTQVLHRTQEASTSTIVVLKVVIVNTFKWKGMPRLSHLALRTALQGDHSRRTRNFL